MLPDNSTRPAKGRPLAWHERSLPCLVHPVTIHTLRNFLAFLNVAAANQGISLRIMTRFDGDALAEFGSLLAMGEKLVGLRAIPGNRVRWVNWSVLVPIRGLFHCSVRGYLWMMRKRRRFLQNCPAFFSVYDFYPSHARAMQSRWPSMQVIPFPIGLYSEPAQGTVGSCASYDYDVCAVGARSSRRDLVCAALERAGLLVSPRKGPFEELICRSRLVLNVHQHRSDNCEAHRILSAYAHGRVVVSEHILGLEECLDPRWVISANVREIPAVICELLRNPERLEILGKQAFEYYWQQFWPYALKWWENTLGSLP